MKQTCLHGALRDLLDAGDLRQRQPFLEYQLHTLALRRIELVDAILQQLLTLIFLQLLDNATGMLDFDMDSNVIDSTKLNSVIYPS